MPDRFPLPTLADRAEMEYAETLSHLDALIATIAEMKERVKPERVGWDDP